MNWLEFANLFSELFVWLIAILLFGFGIWLIINYRKMNLRKLDERGVFWTAVFAIAASLLMFALNLGWIK